MSRVREEEAGERVQDGCSATQDGREEEKSDDDDEHAEGDLSDTQGEGVHPKPQRQALDPTP